MTENPNYYAILPSNVRYDKRLTANAKLLYAEITALTNMNGKCYATNDYFAKLYGVSKNSITNWIKQLCDFGYIKSEIIYKEGSKEILGRYIKLFGYPTQKILDTPTQKICEENNNTNVYNNNTLTESNNIKETYKEKFEQFWKFYTPIKNKEGHFVAKGNKQTCLKKFINILNEGVDYETIIRGLEKYLTYCKNNGYSSCGAEVFLNQRRFENDYSDSECVDSKTGNLQRRPVSIVQIAAELTKESKYDDTNCIPF